MRFISRTFRKIALPLAFAAAYTMSIYGYEHKARINENFEMDRYQGNHVVMFTNAKDEITMPPLERIPYENGIHGAPFALEHEEIHIDIEAYGGIHDERGINSYVRAKHGYPRDPFPSY